MYYGASATFPGVEKQPKVENDLRRSSTLKNSIGEEYDKLIKASKYSYPPKPIKQADGTIVSGRSYRYPGRPIPVVPFDIGRYTNDRINKEEFAFLQLSLIETIELNDRKDNELKLYSEDGNKIKDKLKSYILQRNELYKDYAKVAKDWKEVEIGRAHV